MRILELHLNGFGRFQELTLAFPTCFSVIVGPNEAGKTTAIDAVSGILFGFRRGLKNLRERYQPWAGTRYSASMLLAAEDGTRYLIGRDFIHDRLEIFRGRGMRLEPLAENELEGLLQGGLGVSTPQLFESTLLIRQPETNLLGRDRSVSGCLAEAFGRKISGGDENATAAQALKTIRARLAKVNSAEGPGSIAELVAEAGAGERSLAQMDQGYRHYAALVEERDRIAAGVNCLETELKELSNRIESIKASMMRMETRARLADELDGAQKQLAGMAQTKEDLGRVRGERSLLEANPLDPLAMARAEELANRIASLEVERRYGDEACRQYQAEVEMLEREIAVTNAKLDALDTQLLDVDLQNRLAQLLPIVNENTSRLGDLFPAVDRLVERLRGLRIARLVCFSLSFAASIAAVAAREFLPQLDALGLAAVAGLLVTLTAIQVAWSSRTRAHAKRLSEEIDRREGELKMRRAEMDRFLQGKTPSQIQAEQEASRLYRNDLWHLEQALAQKKAGSRPEKDLAALGQSLSETERELAALLEAAGCRDLAALRDKTARLSSLASEETTFRAVLGVLGDGSSHEELVARERELEEQLRALDAEAQVDTSGLGLLVEQHNQLSTRIGEARMHLTELSGEIRNYQEFVLVRDRFEIEANLAEVRNRLADALTTQRGLALAAKRLEESAFEAQAAIGPELQEQTSAILAEVSCGRYREVQIGLTPTGLEIRVRAPETGSMVAPAALSTGTLDQLHLALRLALAQQLTHENCIPVLLDDPFASFDRQRLAAAIGVLAHFARQNQVIWFTRDKDLAGWIANETGLEPAVVELPGRGEETAPGTAAEDGKQQEGS